MIDTDEGPIVIANRRQDRQRGGYRRVVDLVVKEMHAIEGGRNKEVWPRVLLR